MITHKDTLGIIIPFQGMYSYSEILNGASSLATQLGYQIQAFYGAADQLHQYYDTERIAAWTIINSVEGNRWLNDLDQRIPQLIISPEHEDIRRSMIIPDNVGGARMVVDHLINHGHERIVFIGGLKHADIAGRYRGYQQALEQASLQLDPQLTIDIIQEPFWHRQTADAMLTAFLHKEIPFTAIFAATDELAFGVLSALQRAGLSVPDQIALVSFDDSPPAATARPPLTSVRQSFNDLGRTAARVMIDMHQGNITGRQVYEIMAHVVTRTSCGCMPQYMYDDLIFASREQADSQEQIIFSISEVLVVGADVPTSDVYSYVRQLYAGLCEVLVSYDLKQWSKILEQNLPPLLSRPELINNLPNVLKLLGQYTVATTVANLTRQAVQERAAHLTSLAERAAVFFGVLGNHIQNGRWFELSNATLQITRVLSALDYEHLIELDWLKNSSIQFAALFLLDHSTGTMHLRGTFQAAEHDKNPSFAQRVVDRIPPPGLVHEADVPIAMIHTLEFKERIFGVVYIIPEEGNSVIAHTYSGIWVEQLAGLLNRFELEDNLRKNNASLQALHDQERELSIVIRDLSAPVVPITEGIVILPLIGSIDDKRAEQIIQNLLEAVSSYDAEVIVLDITGVPIVDTQTASYLLRATQAVRLLGAKVVLTGIRPEIAQTIVHLGIDTAQITTAANMEAGLSYALRQRGLQIARMS